MDVQVREGVYYTEKDEEGVLVDSDTGVFFALNATGTRIWRALHAGDIASLVSEWSNQFGLAETEVQHDIDEFCGRLAEEGLVDVGDTSPADGTR